MGKTTEKPTMPTEFRISILLKKEGPCWVAQCLQHDVAGQGSTIQEAFYQVERALFGHMVYDLERGVEPLAKLKRAPDVYWRMFGRAEPLRRDLADPFGSAIGNQVIIPELRVE